MRDYINVGTKEHAQYQMELHKALCRRARGIDTPLPTRTKAEVKRIATHCSVCGFQLDVEVARYVKGKNSCSECRQEKTKGGRVMAVCIHCGDRQYVRQAALRLATELRGGITCRNCYWIARGK